MNGKILCITIVILMFLGSYGAVGTHVNNDTETNKINFSANHSTGLIEPSGWRSKAASDDMSGLSDPPSSWDWRDEGDNFPPVRNQKNCGSCWAFATVGPLECNLWIDGITDDLSEQWLVSCNKDGYSCNGGWWAHDYHAGKPGYCGGTGAVYEDDFPYSATNGHCSGSYVHRYILKDTNGDGSGWAYIGNKYSVPTPDKIKKAIYNYGPISVAVAVDTPFHDYKGGIFQGTGYSSVNHGVTLVGYKDTPGENNEGYWILRNSWGNWGESGYMRIAYGANRVGYAAAYIDGYESLVTTDQVFKIEVESVTNSNMDDIDTSFDIFRGGVKPEWYFDIRVKQGENGDWKYFHLENKYSSDSDNSGFWIWDWKSAHTWNNINKVFMVDIENEVIYYEIRLCDDDVVEGGDLAGDDCADISSASGGGEDDNIRWSDNEGAIYSGSYNVKEKTEETIVANGNDDGGSGDQNDAKLTFTVSDTYDPSLYRPKIGIDPYGTINFGEVNEDKTKDTTLTITNSASNDPVFSNEDLKWKASVESGSNWITVVPSNEQSVPAGDSDTLTVRISTSSLDGSRSGNGYSGKIKIESENAANQKTYNIDVKVTVTKSKSRSIISNAFLFEFLQMLKTHFFPIFSELDLNL